MPLITSVQFRAVLSVLGHRVKDAAKIARMHPNRLSRFLNGMSPTPDTAKKLSKYAEGAGIVVVGNWMYVPNMRYAEDSHEALALNKCDARDVLERGVMLNESRRCVEEKDVQGDEN